MKSYCERCKKESMVTIMSIFNTDEICKACKEEEKKHPLYQKAKQIEAEQVRNGNYNYEGIFSGEDWDSIVKKR